MGAKDFVQLDVWREAHQGVLETYRLTAALPPEERYGLQSQMRRAAVSVAANLAEGFTRPTRLDKLRFYGVAQASLAELRYFGILVADLGLLRPPGPWLARLDRTGAMLGRLCAVIREAHATGS
jgi:four helix bundle protein